MLRLLIIVPILTGCATVVQPTPDAIPVPMPAPTAPMPAPMPPPLPVCPKHPVNYPCREQNINEKTYPSRGHINERSIQKTFS